MIVASIDLMQGKAVQLVEGKEKVLEQDNPVELAKEFNRYGEIAVIDLDAAMRKTKNIENQKIIHEICAFADCRAGGGIGTVEQAGELVSRGARKVIIGSKAFENNKLNIPFLQELGQAIGKERVMVAIDARDREIVSKGWQYSTGLSLIETAKALEPYVSEFLFTCVEREGRKQGTDLETVNALKQEIKIPITAAGGVHSLQQVETLAQLGVDVQLGMALYTGSIQLAEGFVCSLNWKQPLLPVITVDSSGQVLMQAYTNKAALEKTFETGYMWYYSRSRQRLWQKGETSGNRQKLIKLRVDCDRDTVLATVDQTGPACHLGNYSCFGDRKFTLDQLYKVIEDRFKNPRPGSYTATLDHKKVREKILEEAAEVVEAKSREDIIWEAADVLYFLTVLLQKQGISIDDVLMELHRRRLATKTQRHQDTQKNL
jgi:phosphoribosyl-ATP pyrophosphohydrolase/phosphoribosyl-AMP cyclohydrolase